MAFGKAKPPVDIAWRPDFRMPERLPDIKPVRTDFFINFAALSLALFSLFLVCFQEYTIFNKKAEISRKVEDLVSMSQKQDEYFRQNVAFVKTEPFLKEFALFNTRQISAADLLILLSRETPKDITLDSVRLQPIVRPLPAPSKSSVIVTAIQVAGYVRDPDTRKADESIDKFLATLFAAKELKGKNISHAKDDKAFVRDAERGIVKFAFRIELSPAPPAAAKPAAK